MISLRNFSYRYPSQERFALQELNLEIKAGQFCGVVGANGAGKSTLCYALSGFAPHFFRGEVQGQGLIGKLDIAKSSLGELAGEVGLVFQNAFNQISGARFTVRGEIAFGLENLGIARRQIQARVDDVLDALNLTDLASRSPYELSGGQQQRVAIASILAMRPKVLVLDEPVSQLDPHGTEEIFKIIEMISQSGETTVVLVEHKLEWLAAYADRVLVLDQGRVVMDGPARSVLASADMMKLGIGRTQYSQVAEIARKQGLVSDAGLLPVTLKQARALFR
ncbi:MAG: ABC transporter ATP-binding protein [Anaerolineales bacterium]